MRSDCRFLPRISAARRDTVLVADAVESIAAYALVQPRIRPCVDVSGLRQAGVKRRIEDGDLHGLGA